MKRRDKIVGSRLDSKGSVGRDAETAEDRELEKIQATIDSTVDDEPLTAYEERAVGGGYDEDEDRPW